MKLSDEQFREQLVDYLYGELQGDELAAFEASLTESEEQRRELAALEQTLGAVRRGLKESLVEEPPLRVRAAILAAASELSREQPARPAPSKLRVLVGKLGRHPVLYPALGIAAAFALVVLGKRVEHERYASESADSLSASEREKIAEGAAERAASERGKAEQPSAPSLQFAEPPPASPDDYVRAPAQEALRRRAASGASGSEGAPKKGRASAGRALPGGGSGAQREQAASRFAEAPAELERSEGVALAGAADRDDERRDEARARGGLGASGQGAEAKATSGARRAVPAAPAASADKSVAEESEPAFAAPAPTSASAKPAAKRAAEVADSSALTANAEELIRRAREHFGAGRFREASVSYRTLLERFPKDARAASWRKELARAQRAAQAQTD